MVPSDKFKSDRPKKWIRHKKKNPHIYCMYYEQRDHGIMMDCIVKEKHQIVRNNKKKTMLLSVHTSSFGSKLRWVWRLVLHQDSKHDVVSTLYHTNNPQRKLC